MSYQRNKYQYRSNRGGRYRNNYGNRGGGANQPYRSRPFRDYDPTRSTREAALDDMLHDHEVARERARKRKEKQKQKRHDKK